VLATYKNTSKKWPLKFSPSFVRPINELLILIYLLTAIGLTPSGSSTVHIYTKTIHRTTQLTTLVGRLSEFRTHGDQTKINIDLST
jgi:uncharacterized integral membrane protein